MPVKEIPKVSFVLLPFQDLLPSIASPDGYAPQPSCTHSKILSSSRNSRLNANRMLRAKKVLAYVAERIETPSEQSDSDSFKPEDYLELLCQDQLVAHNTTLATLRAHVWKAGGDVILYYKSNGRRPELEERERIRKEKAAVDTAKTGPVLHT